MLTSSESHIEFRSHSVHIRVNGEGCISCFKYNSAHCEWEQFDNEYDAADFIFKELNPYRYVVSWATEARH